MSKFILVPKQKEITIDSTFNEVLSSYPNYEIKAFDGYIYVGVCSKSGKPINESMNYVTTSSGDFILEEML